MFDTSDGGVSDVVGGTVFLKSSINLASADNNAFDFLGLLNSTAVFGVRDNPLEV